MSKAALAAALPLLLLAACGGSERQPAPESAAEAEANALGNSSSAQPAQPAGSAADGAEPVPPPDAVSHPDGYLPPAPGEAVTTNAGSAGPDGSPPATEDEYIRNGQGAR